MKKLIRIIKNKNWIEILEYSKSLSDSERYSTIETLRKIDIDNHILQENGSNLIGEKRSEFYENRQQIDSCLNYFLITCTRNYEDLKILEEPHEFGVYSPFYRFITTDQYQPLIAFYKLFPPDYLDKVLKQISKDRFGNVNFKFLWKWYEHKWVVFDEAFFVRSLLEVRMFTRNTMDDAAFLYENREALESVFLKFYKHETPILDISKWNARDGFVCKKVWEFWTEVILILQEKGYEFDRTILSNLFNSLLNNWKKTHLNWHVRLLKLFKPDHDELIENQVTLFSILGTGHTSLMNYSIQCIKVIHKREDFDKKSFIENFILTFSNEKMTKSILIGLGIIESYLSKSYEIDVTFKDDIAVLLMQANTKVQEKVAEILVKYFYDDDLKDTVEPYRTYLRQESKAILGLEDEVGLSISDTRIERELNPIHTITNWDDLLLHIGTCIRTQSLADIDLFYESLAVLQSEIPNNYAKQLKPYTKLLFNRGWENHTILIFAHFIERWISNRYSSIDYEKENPIPFVVIKTNLLLEKLKNKNNLPFLSTPTHEPFFIEPSAILSKLFKYEERKENVHLEDLIVACNRVLKSKINKELAEKSKSLKGYYGEAIQYLLGATDKINFTKSTLPLWAQISRIRNPNKQFPEFKKSYAANYHTVVKPFEISFNTKVDANDYATWYRLTLEDNWNYSWYNKEVRLVYDYVFYNTASAEKGYRKDIESQISLNPNYIDALLCRYIPDTASGNEVSGFEECLYPMRFILESQLYIYHSGWLYIAACLLFEKRISRDLATEYIHLAISRKDDLDYLAQTIGILLSLKHAPINRFIEYLDKPTEYVEVKQFQYQTLTQCIMLINSDNKPRNSKKIIQYYKEWLNFLKLEMPSEVKEKITNLK